jgi:tetratricopeptide (TPR) repeat protein
MPDKDAAMKAVRGAHPVSRVESFAMPETFRPICDADRPDCDRSTSDRLRDNATTLADEARASAGTVAGVLPGLIRSLARVDGRKAVLLFSERLAVNDPAQLARDTLDAALRTEARLYIVDPRATGREIDDDGGAADALARDAGGFVVRGSTVADGTLEQVARDLDAYYALGFWTDVDIDGGLHRVTVRTTRADVRLRVWPAYLATGRAAPAAPAGAVRWESVRAARPAAPADPGRRVEAASEPPGSVATGVVVTAPPASGAAAVRVRPTASQNVEHLSAGEWIDTNAEAGWEAYQRGDLESARTSLLAATARPGVLSWVRYALGTANYALGHFADAAAEWERVRDRHPEFEPVYFDLADAYVQLRAREKAIALLRTAQGRWPLDAEIYNDLGTVQASAGSLDDAIKTFEEAVRVVPDESITYLNLAQALELRYVKQVRYIRELRKYLWNERDRDGAIKNYERYLEFGGPYADRARQGLERVKTAPR